MIYSIVAAAALISETQNESSNVEPANNPGTWINRSDYPLEELRNRIEGTARFELTIGTDGLVKSCKITSSTGSSALDYTTCNKVTERARFRPAINATGEAVEGSWKNAVRWQIPSQAPNLTSAREAFSLTLPHEVSTTSKITLVREKDGSISSCKFGHFVPEEQEKALCDRAKWQFGKNMPDGLFKDRVKIVVSTTTKTEMSLAESDE